MALGPDNLFLGLTREEGGGKLVGQIDHQGAMKRRNTVLIYAGTSTVKVDKLRTLN